MGISVISPSTQAQPSISPEGAAGSVATSGENSFSLLFAALNGLSNVPGNIGADAMALGRNEQFQLPAASLAENLDSGEIPLLPADNGLSSDFSDLGLPFFPPALSTKDSKTADNEKSDDSRDTAGSTDIFPGLLPASLVQQSIQVPANAEAATTAGEQELPAISDVLARPGKGATANLAAASSDAKMAASIPAQGDAIELQGENGGSDNNTDFANLLQGTSARTSAGEAGQASTPASSPRIDTAVGNHKWGEALGERMVWMAKNDSQSAQITLNPPQLGPLQVTLNIDGNQASAAFASPHAEVRQLIEDAMPRLREMLADSGINLGGSSVGSQLPQQQSQDARNLSHGARFSGETAILPGDATNAGQQGTLPLQSGRGLVDLFA